MKKQVSLGILLSAGIAAAPYTVAKESSSIIHNPSFLLAATDDIPEGYHRMPDGTLMPNSKSTTITIDDLGGILPQGYHIMQDGKVMANDPTQATAPEGYKLQPDGTLIANEISGSIVPEGFHMMPDGTLMAQGGDGTAHHHHDSGGHHGAGMWMFEYKYMRMNMQDLKDANTKISPAAILYEPYSFDAAPTKMTMDMHMFMLMYGLSDKITLMGMSHYIINDMDMLLNDATGETTTMHTSGIGDTILSASLQIPHNLELGFGASLPTGSINEKGPMKMSGGMTMPMTYPYAMQLGSGTIDIIPSIAYRQSWNNFAFGSKLGYTMRTKKNDKDYRLGNIFEINGFINWNFHKNVSANFKATLLSQERIDGEADETRIMGANNRGSPSAHPNLYGGTRIDLSIGAKIKTSNQMYYVKPELAVPFYQNLWGPQMRTSWILSTSIGAMF